MTIAWNEFTPWSALVGGMLIGLAAALLVLLQGRIAGISGVLGGALGAAGGDRGWRFAFLGGLLVAPWLAAAVAGPLAPRIDAGIATLTAAGALVGIGTRYAAGCTSGHGVCGLARGSLRSLVATLCFMAAGFATVFVVRHVLR